MPRRRALRVLGMSVAAAAVPSIRPRSASGAAVTTSRCNPQAEKCCPTDERVCGLPGAQYCCPSPSWQFQCGGSSGPRCVNMCRGAAPKDATGRTGRNFPCTAVIAHPESGINGVCCNTRDHALCEPVGPTTAFCCKPFNPRKPEEGQTCKPVPSGGSCTGKGAYRVPAEPWKPSCCPKAFGCRGVCCQPPNRCKNGICRCPSGERSCDGSTCCPKGKSCESCVERTSLLEGLPGQKFRDYRETKVGKKCCPPGQICCRKTCCRGKTCCGEECCPSGKFCAHEVDGTGDICCPGSRLIVLRGSNRVLCCPTGTVAAEFGCCPASEPTCCPRRDPSGGFIDCEARGEVCVDGQCEAP